MFKVNAGSATQIVIFNKPQNQDYEKRHDYFRLTTARIKTTEGKVPDEMHQDPQD